MREFEVAHAALTGGPASRRRLYAQLAAGLAAIGPSGAAVFETSLCGPPPDVYFRPPTLLGAPGAITVPGVRAVVGPARLPRSPPPEDSLHRFGVVIPSRRAAPPGWVGPPIGSPHPRIVPPGTDSVWAAVQVVWAGLRPCGLAVAARFHVAGPRTSVVDELYQQLALRVATDWTQAIGLPAVAEPTGFGSGRDWGRAGIRTIPRRAWCEVTVERAPATPEVGLADLEPPDPGGNHTVILGASGTGKTTLLARRAIEAVKRRQPVVVLDLHGDLAPAIAAALPPEAHATPVAIDASHRPIPGVAGWNADEGSVDRAAAHFVGAVKRLTPDGTDLAWGFRLERIFDTLARLTVGSRGSLLDLYALLTDRQRREAARAEAQTPATRQFLEELEPIVRRNPEFLWSAATRLSKVVLVPELAELLAPPDGGLDVEELVRGGRALLLRLPIATLGPEAASFAATLLLGRIYLGLAARVPPSAHDPPTLLLLDEAQSFPPRLVAEILSDSRKFRMEAWIATQYPDRLSPEVKSAAAGAASNFVVFRVPAASAADVAPWVGLDARRGPELLGALPTGAALLLGPESGTPRWYVGGPLSVQDGGRAWAEALERTRAEFPSEIPSGPFGPDEEAVQRILLAILAADERELHLAKRQVVRAAWSLPGPPADLDALERAWVRLKNAPEVEVAREKVRLTETGARRVGLWAETGAVGESEEHRALLVRAFCVFARRGYAIEIVRQGRFDLRLPDGTFRQFGASLPTAPWAVADVVERVRSGWAWTAFGGKDVHLEAEVSGSRYPQRIRRNLRKATYRGAFALFLVSNLTAARRVRNVLSMLGATRHQAGVWVLTSRWNWGEGVGKGLRPIPNSCGHFSRWRRPHRSWAAKHFPRTI